MNEYDHLMSEATPTDEESAEARKYFAKRAARAAGSGTVRKKKTAKRAPKKKATKAKAKINVEAEAEAETS